MRQLRCAYLTMDDIGDFVTDADMSFAPMAERAWSIDMVSWRDAAADWDSYDAVYICTPWDYPEDAEAFLDTLRRIDRSRALLVNGLDLVLWNLEKTYLRDIERRGGANVPSRWHTDFDGSVLDDAFSAFASERIVIKPVVGANAVDAFVLERPVTEAMLNRLQSTFSARPFFVQPYIDNIETDGEYSLFFFAGNYSHAIRKVPKPGDFRVQEEHGADILAVDAAGELVDVATAIVGLVEPVPVYVRADFVRGDNDRFLLMELELIEPSLYLRTDAGAARRFAQAFDAHVRAGGV